MMRPNPESERGALRGDPVHPSPTPGYQGTGATPDHCYPGFDPKAGETSASAGRRVRDQVRAIVRKAGGKPADLG